MGVHAPPRRDTHDQTPPDPRSGSCSSPPPWPFPAAKRKTARPYNCPDSPSTTPAVYAKETPASADRTFLAADLTGFERPTTPLEFTKFFHLPPVEQGNTGTCWSFAATLAPRVRAEAPGQGRGQALRALHRLLGVRGEGPPLRPRKGEVLPRPGLRAQLGPGPDQAVRPRPRRRLHRAPRREDRPRPQRRSSASSRSYLAGLADRNEWDEDRALAGVRAILDRHLGRPPDRITVDGRSLTPLQYLAELGLVPDDYVAFISFMYLPFYTKGELKVPDNWWHAADFHNLPLHEFSLAFLRALRKGYTATLGRSISPSRATSARATWPWCPPSTSRRATSTSRAANTGSRTARPRTTTPSTASATSSQTKGNWFLIKDSWENAYWGQAKGYFFYQDDYVRLKALMFMVHKDAAKEVLEKFAAK
ncbi:MAG: hypothetical protein M0C28_37875 [Candidatus Moduliflexus flocculans]|nr:hypothetical protein [Candidatus Moduliflexus flocculans]